MDWHLSLQALTSGRLNMELSPRFFQRHFATLFKSVRAFRYLIYGWMLCVRNFFVIQIEPSNRAQVSYKAMTMTGILLSLLWLMSTKMRTLPLLQRHPLIVMEGASQTPIALSGHESWTAQAFTWRSGIQETVPCRWVVSEI